MHERTTVRRSSAWILPFLLLLSGWFALAAPDASARSSYYGTNCAPCHGSTPTTCNGCHHHGKSGLSATTDKTTYAPGEMMAVTFRGGSESGWIRAILYNQGNVELARSTGPSGRGGGAGFPITFTVPAPAASTTPYTYTAAWFGNMYDTGNLTTASHGEERVATNQFTVSTPADTTPPTVSSTAPANGATNVNPGTMATAVFSEAVNASTVSTSTFTLRQGTTNVSGTVTLSGTTATFRPSAALANGTTYTATVTTGVRDTAGNAMAANYAWSFTTAAAADSTPPTVNSTNPSNNQTGVAVNGSVSATFNEAVAPASISTSSFTVSGVSGTVGVSGTTATFTPSAPLAFNTTYTATITTAATDLAANHLAANYAWSFTTSAAPDTTPPTVASTSPVSGATAVPVSSVVSATFSETLKASTVTTATFNLKQGTTSIPGTVTLSGTTATFRPTSALAGSTTYTATATTGVQDAAGNTLAQPYSWSFTTAAAADGTPPAVSSVSPPDGATGVAVNASATATFSEPIDPLTATTATFSLKNGSATVAGAVSTSGGIATFRPTLALASSTTYTATLATGIKDLAGNALASAYSWTFTTGAAADTAPPTVTGTSPAVNATGIPATTAVTATFSEKLDAATVTTATFTLKNGANAPVAGAVTFAGTTATFAPAAPLAANATYTAQLTTGIRDAAGNALAQPYSWPFTTAAASTIDRDGDGASDADDDYPDDDRIGTVRDGKGHGKIKIDVSMTSGAYLRGMTAKVDSDPSINQTGKPAGHEFRHGLVEYDVHGIAPGSTARVYLTFPEKIPAGSKVYQVNSGGFSVLPGAVIDGSTVMLTLTDGGSGDRDQSRNGVIADPVGVASPVAAETSAAGGGGCSMAGPGGTPVDLAGAYGALGFALLLLALRRRGGPGRS